VTDRTSRRPDRAAATAVKDALRRRGVLVGTTGKNGNILKIRPPLAFTDDLVPTFTSALTAALEDYAPRGTA
jgi:4-aminobutyrate aminotransferase-like enzyme